jgi:hypothetical protein
VPNHHDNTGNNQQGAKQDEGKPMFCLHEIGASVSRILEGFIIFPSIRVPERREGFRFFHYRGCPETDWDFQVFFFYLVFF